MHLDLFLGMVGMSDGEFRIKVGGVNIILQRWKSVKG